MKLSVYIPAHNEERHLEACLQTLGFADEIVVQLDNCTDGSKAIAQKYAHKIIEGVWPQEGTRRNVGMNACSGDWILDVDADERIPPALASEIRDVISTSTYDYHAIPFDNYIGQNLVKYGWGAYIGVSQKLGLYRQGTKKYAADDLIHCRVTLQGRIGPMLQHAITHYVDDDLSDLLRRFDRYTTAHAKELIARRDTDGFGRNVVRIFTRFYKCYIRRKGYKEGALGFFVAVLGGLYPLASYVKAKYRV